MPIIGFYSGVLIEKIIQKYDHWIAFALLSLIGIKMIIESFSIRDDNQKQSDPSKGKNLIILSIATSIDAAAIGFSFAALNISILIPSIIIGVICVFFSALGLFIGNETGSIVGVWAERIGGIVLILIGVKILLEHLV